MNDLHLDTRPDSVVAEASRAAGASRNATFARAPVPGSGYRGVRGLRAIKEARLRRKRMGKDSRAETKKRVGPRELPREHVTNDTREPDRLDTDSTRLDPT